MASVWTTRLEVECHRLAGKQKELRDGLIVIVSFGLYMGFVDSKKNKE